MHFYDVANHFMGGWGIVGAQCPVAAGIAFAQKYQNTDGVTICFLGDGAINIGPFHEAMSLAALWNLPVIFIIENNQFAMGTPLHKTAPVEDVSIRAMGYPMARDTMDGHDVFAVRSVMHAAVKRAREQKLPTLIEAKTYRYRGHSMADPGTYRTKEEVEERKKLDPIFSLGSKLESLGMSAAKTKIDDAIEAEIQDAVKFAEESNFPDPSTAAQYVYCDDTPLM
jgi:pyruvate dehydrogenase E1 component alpha subunit